MPTTNPRINITVSAKIAEALQTEAVHTGKSVSQTALDLIEWAIEKREDRYFSKLADDRLSSNPKWVPYSEDIWK